MSKLSLLLPLLLVSCTNDPFIRTPEGAVVSLGQTWLKKETGVSKGYEGPHGKLWVNRTSGDETVVPGKLINYYGIKAATEGAVSMLRTTESTKRVLGSQEVTKQGIQSAERVESLKILNPVEAVPAP